MTEDITDLTGENGIVSIIDGGDSAHAVNPSGLAPEMPHVLAGGGASLELLEDEVLPSATAQEKKGDACYRVL